MSCVTPESMKSSSGSPPSSISTCVFCCVSMTEAPSVNSTLRSGCATRVCSSRMKWPMTECHSGTGMATTIELRMSKVKEIACERSSMSFDGRLVTSASCTSTLICSSTLVLPLRPRCARIWSHRSSISASL